MFHVIILLCSFGQIHSLSGVKTAKKKKSSTEEIYESCDRSDEVDKNHPENLRLKHEIGINGKSLESVILLKVNLDAFIQRSQV